MINFDFFISHISEQVCGMGRSDIINVVIHSAEVREGDCFVGLAGIKFDGGSFFLDALERGARGIIIHKQYFYEAKKLFQVFSDAWFFFVDDTKKLFIELSSLWRKRFSIPIVAVTGSAGKTTTKELVKLLCQKAGMSVCATKLSQNGTIGLSLSLFQLRCDHDIGIFEVGIQRPGEIDVLIFLLKEVTYSILTTILSSHIVYFKNKENVFSEKIKLQSITTQCLFIDEEYSNEVSSQTKIITCGKNRKSDNYYFYQNDCLFLVNNTTFYSLSIPYFYHTGLHHCLSFVFAFGIHFGISLQVIRDTILEFNQVDGRFSISKSSFGSQVINDSYNACSPEVVITSIHSFIYYLPSSKKIIVLGDMFEQGELTTENHNKVIYEVEKLLSNQCFEKAFFIGNNYCTCIKSNSMSKMLFFKTFEEAYTFFLPYLSDESYAFLFKSSRGTKFYDYYLPQYVFLKED